MGRGFELSEQLRLAGRAEVEAGEELRLTVGAKALDSSEPKSR